PQRRRLEPVNLLHYFDQGVPRIQVERAQDIAELNVEIHDHRAARPELSERGRCMDRERGRSRTPAAAEERENPPTRRGRSPRLVDPEIPAVGGHELQTFGSFQAHRMNPTFPSGFSACDSPMPNKNSSTSPGSETSSSPGIVMRSPLPSGTTR